MNRFLLTVTAIVGLGYAYVAARLGVGIADRLALALPFFLVWVVPGVYWRSDREETRFDELVHVASYLSMAWVSFLFVFTLLRDAALAAAAVASATQAYAAVQEFGTRVVYAGSVLALVVGALTALRGPSVVTIDVPIDGLDPALDGFRIAQISDLHVGLTIRNHYVRRVVELANALEPDVVVLTGDIVDGSVEELAPHVAPLTELRAPQFFILGNHDCYSGATQWIRQFRSMGMHVLLNAGERVTKGGASVWLGGVVDPAIRLSNPRLVPDAEAAADGARGGECRVLLAHNPKLTKLGARAGFHLQLSGHTHGGQFFPWTLAVRLVHAPHVAGLSREGKMWVYVSAGTGTWGPPVRFGTKPELTLVTLVRRKSDG